jgi:hypothetical protein
MASLLRFYVVRQGDYLTALAHIDGFEVDQVWNDSKTRSCAMLGEIGFSSPPAISSIFLKRRGNGSRWGAA